MIQLTDKENCCGCTACYSICPRGCISMMPDEEGFLYPIVNVKLCNNCGACESVCPILNKPNLPIESKGAFIVQTQREETLKDSTSGGFSDVLYRYILDQGGYICGCVYDNEWMPHHVVTNDPEKLSQFRGSKYAQSRLDNIFAEIKELLTNSELVCFVGTPCQVSGLKNYLRRDYERLITVDLVCRSIPSPLLLKQYLNWQEEKNSSKIQFLNCRNKTYGYHNGTLMIKFENGKKYSGSNRVDPFMKAFHSDICSRPSCYKCVFKTPTRCSDFTIFDCWQPERLSEKVKDNNKGYSNVIIHSSKGFEIFRELRGINKWKTSSTKMFQFTGGMESKAVIRPEARKMFYQKLIVNGFEKTIYEFIDITIKDQLIEKMKMFFYKIGILYLIRKIRHN